MEKISCTKVPSEYLDAESVELPPLLEGSVLALSMKSRVRSALLQPCKRYYVLAFPPDGLLPPFSVGYIKGWRRSLMLLVTLAGIRELEIQPEMIGHEILVACLH